MPTTTPASPMRHDETVLTAADSPVRAYRAGGGPALVLLHGGGLDDAQLSWAPVWPVLTGHTRLLAPDLPGWSLPALCVDELSGYATAGLHHRGCRPPGWNDSSLIITSSGGVLSWQACALLLLPGAAGPRPDPRPALPVNPGLEQVTLKPADGTWRPSYEAPFDMMGVVPPGPGLVLNRPVAGATVWLGAGEVSVSIELWSREHSAEAPGRSWPPRSSWAGCCSW